VVVDVDGDGMTEIVVPNGGSHGDTEAFGLYVLGSADGSWPTNRRVWNQHAYAVTNIGDDLEIPAFPVPNWPTYDTFRSGTTSVPVGDATPDAVPVTDVCLDECYAGTLIVYARVGNEGTADLDPVDVALMADGEVLATARTAGSVVSGGVSETLTFSVDRDTVAHRTLSVVIDGEGAVAECNEANNGTDVAGCPTSP
jgi:hypothetical protein